MLFYFHLSSRVNETEDCVILQLGLVTFIIHMCIRILPQSTSISLYKLRTSKNELNLIFEDHPTFRHYTMLKLW